ncbi:MAG TPA: Gfo/Idh/MocA family oxidoreductase [Dongiaceae bacterium]|nr:Gfo/Idh/MocA family oxidoreductase [Dongiaceae bacterium]
MIRIGLIGCGAWGRYILRDLKACGAVVHVADPDDAARHNAVGQQAGSIVDDFARLPAVDGYVVAAPSSLHARIIEALLPSGRPIFTEKPMTADPASARRIAEAGADRVFVMQKWRYHPGIERMRQEIAGGGIGDVLAIQIHRWSWGTPHRDVSPVWTLMPHDLSIVLHWLGDIPPLLFARRTHPGAVGTGLIAQLGERSGPVITIDMSVAAAEHCRNFSVVGSRACMELRDSPGAAIRTRRGPPGDAAAAAESIAIGREMPLLLELQAFLAYLDGGAAPMSSAREGQLIVERTAEIEAAAHAAAGA